MLRVGEASSWRDERFASCISRVQPFVWLLLSACRVRFFRMKQRRQEKTSQLLQPMIPFEACVYPLPRCISSIAHPPSQSRNRNGSGSLQSSGRQVWSTWTCSSRTGASGPATGLVVAEGKMGRMRSRRLAHGCKTISP